jgi:hypothetical protein
MATLLVIGSGKKGAPPPAPGGARAPKGAPPPPPPGADDDNDQGNEPDNDQDDQGAGAISPAEVGYAEGTCADCKYMAGAQCSKYQFEVAPNGRCLAGYEPQDAGNDQGDQGQPA